MIYILTRLEVYAEPTASPRWYTLVAQYRTKKDGKVTAIPNLTLIKRSGYAERLITCFGYESKFLSNWANLQTTLLILRQSQSHSLGPEDVNQIVLNCQTNRGKIVGEACQYRGVFPRISHYARLGVKHQRIGQHHLSHPTTWLSITINASSGIGKIFAALVTSYAKRQKAVHTSLIASQLRARHLWKVIGF